jgi:hypothetical protein
MNILALRELLPDYYVDDGMLDGDPCIRICHLGAGTNKEAKATTLFFEDGWLIALYPFKDTLQEELDADDLGLKAELRSCADSAFAEYEIANPEFDVVDLAADIRRVMKCF